METSTESNQATITPEEVVGEAGKSEAVETAKTEADAGLLEGESGVSVEDIMSEGAAEKTPEGETLQHGVQKKINKEVSRRKQAEERASQAEKRLQEMESISAAPVDRPLTPLREDYDTGQEYQQAFAKYEQDTVSFNQSQVAVNDQKARLDNQRTANTDRFNKRADRMRAKFSDFDALVTTDNPDGSNPFEGVADLVLNAEYSPEVAYFLRKNPSELEGLQSMDRSSALLKIGEISGKFKTIQKKVTSAPATLNTVSGESDTSPQGSIYKIKDNSEFLKRRNEEILRKRGRPK